MTTVPPSVVSGPSMRMRRGTSGVGGSMLSDLLVTAARASSRRAPCFGVEAPCVERGESMGQKGSEKECGHGMGRGRFRQLRFTSGTLLFFATGSLPVRETMIDFSLSTPPLATEPSGLAPTALPGELEAAASACSTTLTLERWAAQKSSSLVCFCAAAFSFSASARPAPPS